MPNLFLGHTDPERERNHPGLELPVICSRNPPSLDSPFSLLPKARHKLQRDAGLPTST
jgi:hypothetical protein